MHSNNLNKDVGTWYNDVQFNWQAGMSSVATDNGQNTNFAANWNVYQYINYSIQNDASVLSNDLTTFNKMVSQDPSSAVMYYCFVLGQQISNGAADDENKVSDQVTDVSNVSNAVSELKVLFNAANGMTDPTSISQISTDFKNGLNSLSSYVGNDKWLSEIASSFNSTTQGAIPEMQQALTAVGGNLNQLWPDVLVPTYTQVRVNPSYEPNNDLSFSELSISNVPAGFFDYISSQSTSIGADYVQNLFVNIYPYENSNGQLESVVFNVSQNSDNPIFVYIAYCPQNNTLYMGSDEWDTPNHPSGFTLNGTSAENTPVANQINTFTNYIMNNTFNSCAGTLPSINSMWKQYSAQSANETGLQTMLTGFDTMESSSTTIGTQNEEILQYYSGLYQQMATVLGTSQNQEVQALNSINNNIPKSNQ